MTTEKKKIYGLSIFLYVLSISLISFILRRTDMGKWVELAIGIGLITFWLISLNLIFKKYKILGYDDTLNIEVKFYGVEEVRDHVLKYAVIMTQSNGKWIFARHEERLTWEIPGGRREPDENIFKTAERELIEETGASEFVLEPVCVYSVKTKTDQSYGLLCHAKVNAFDNPLTMEICEIKEFETLPEDLTYPLIQPILFEKINAYLEER